MMLNIRPSDNVYSQNIASESLTDYHEARAPPNGQSPFQQLVEELATVLEPCSGLSFHDVDPSTIIRAMEKYESNRREWHKYAFEDFSRAYTRNLVHRGNGKSNLVSSLCRLLYTLPTTIQCVLTRSPSSFSSGRRAARAPSTITLTAIAL